MFKLHSNVMGFFGAVTTTVHNVLQCSFCTRLTFGRPLRNVLFVPCRPYAIHIHDTHPGYDPWWNNPWTIIFQFCVKPYWKATTQIILQQLATVFIDTQVSAIWIKYQTEYTATSKGRTQKPPGISEAHSLADLEGLLCLQFIKLHVSYVSAQAGPHMAVRQCQHPVNMIQKHTAS